MTYQAKAQGAQGTKSTLPPIPKMDAGAPAAQTGDGIGATIRQAVKEVRQEVRQAQADAKQAKADAKQAKADAKQAKADAKVAAKEGQGPVVGTPGTVPPPGIPNFGDDIPPQVVNTINMFLVFFGVLVLGLPIVRMFARRFDRKTQAMQVSGPDLTPQMRQLQESVDAMAIEIERISEGQRFTSKLLAERAAGIPALERKSAG